MKEEARTEKAICFIFPDKKYNKIEGIKQWIPISQISQIHPDRIVISDWIAKKLKLI